MTTITYRSGVMAGDSLICENDTLSGSVVKVARHRSGCLAGAAGDVWWIRKFLLDFAESPRTELFMSTLILPRDTSAMIVPPSGVIYIAERGAVYPVEDPYMAVGSGAPYALVALDLGASAVEAVRAANRRHAYSGGDVFTVERDEVLKAPLASMEAA